MTDNDTTGSREPIDRAGDEAAGRHAMARRPLRRPRERVLGGVCAAVADHLGIDVLLVRMVAIALVLFTGGAGLLAYLAGWLLIPNAQGGDTAPARPPAVETEVPDPRRAWRAVGADLRSLRDAFTAAAPPAATGSARPDDRPLAAVDAALTGLGERLRDPQVQASARRAASGLSAAVGTSLDSVARRRG